MVNSGATPNEEGKDDAKVQGEDSPRRRIGKAVRRVEEDKSRPDHEFNTMKAA